jgi:cytidine deaminase
MSAELDDRAKAELVAAARAARERAHAPYSRFPVGAALLCADGTVVGGCNVENASYAATVCAERTAVATAVAQGKRAFAAIAVIADTPEPVTPCGICRQVLAEFAGDDLPVICASTAGDVAEHALGALLPFGFRRG